MTLKDDTGGKKMCVRKEYETINMLHRQSKVKKYFVYDPLLKKIVKK